MKNILYQESIVEIKHLFHIMKITDRGGAEDGGNQKRLRQYRRHSPNGGRRVRDNALNVKGLLHHFVVI